MRLWTFQYTDFVKELEETGILRASWERIYGLGWISAYQWMRDQMEINNIPCEGFAPIWAWHSCSGFGKCPTLDDARALMVRHDDNNQVKTIEFECPNELVLLSKYGTWNNLLDKFIDEQKIIKVHHQTRKSLFDTRPEKLHPYDSIQATLPYLKLDWVIDIRYLRLYPYDKDDGHEMV